MWPVFEQWLQHPFKLECLFPDGSWAFQGRLSTALLIVFIMVITVAKKKDVKQVRGSQGRRSLDAAVEGGSLGGNGGCSL